MRRPIIDWNDNDFITVIDGIQFRFIVRLAGGKYHAFAQFASDNRENNWHVSDFSTISSEDAMLKLVKIIEDESYN